MSDKKYPCNLSETQYNTLVKEHGPLRVVELKAFHADRPLLSISQYAALPEDERKAIDEKYPDSKFIALCKKPGRHELDSFLNKEKTAPYSAYITLFNACAVVKDSAFENDDELCYRGGQAINDWAAVYSYELKNV